MDKKQRKMKRIQVNTWEHQSKSEKKEKRKESGIQPQIVGNDSSWSGGSDF